MANFLADVRAVFGFWVLVGVWAVARICDVVGWPAGLESVLRRVCAVVVTWGAGSNAETLEEV